MLLWGILQCHWRGGTFAIFDRDVPNQTQEKVLIILVLLFHSIGQSAGRGVFLNILRSGARCIFLTRMHQLRLRKKPCLYKAKYIGDIGATQYQFSSTQAQEKAWSLIDETSLDNISATVSLPQAGEFS